MKKIWTMALLALLGANSTQAADGHELGNGIDVTNPMERLAWFLGPDRVIHACYEIDAGFGIDASTAEKSIQQAFRTWTDYIDEKKLDFYQPSAPIAFAKKMELRSSCSGTEDLTFYFGVRKPELLSYLKEHESSVAFAVPTQRSRDSSWAKGFVWLAMPKSLTSYNTAFPDWNVPNNLLATLLHEFGHIFGCDHISGTIMRSDLDIDLLSKIWWPTSNTLWSIDGNRELVLCEKCTFRYEQRLTVDNLDIIRDAFTTFVGRSPVGEVTMLATGTGMKTNVQVSFLDDLGMHVVPIDFASHGSTSFESGLRSFSRYLSEAGPLMVDDRSEAYIAKARDTRGHEHTVFVEWNSGHDGPIKMQFQKANGTWDSLFYWLRDSSTAPAPRSP